MAAAALLHGLTDPVSGLACLFLAFDFASADEAAKKLISGESARELESLLNAALPHASQVYSSRTRRETWANGSIRQRPCERAPSRASVCASRDADRLPFRLSRIHS